MSELERDGDVAVTETVRLHVAGLDCPDEIALLRHALDGKPGVGELSFNLIQATMTVVHEPFVASSVGGPDRSSKNW